MRPGDTQNLKKYRLALVCDWLCSWGGAEQVFLTLCEMFPKAKVLSLFYQEEIRKRFFSKVHLESSFLQELPYFLRRHYRLLLPIFPWAAESLDLRDFDVVISSTNSFVKGLITKPEALHLSYCHAPMRYAWDWYHSYLQEQGFGRTKRALAKLILHYLRLWDRQAAERVDFFVANSRATQQKLKKYYQANSQVIYPPVAVENFSLAQNKGEYFLVVSRLSPYKRIDLAIQAFNQLRLPLVIVGEGPDKRRLKAMSQSSIVFLGARYGQELTKIYTHAKALIFPGEDDFGMSIVEAMACGRPVLAYRAGGALETVVEGQTGEFFSCPNPESLIKGVKRLSKRLGSYDPFLIRKQALRFSKKNFQDKFLATLRYLLSNR